MDKPYRRLPVNCTPCYISFVECLARMLPADGYYIHAGQYAYLDIKSMMQLEWQTKNPFTPPVNLIFDDSLEPREWYINPMRHTKMENRNADCWGSEGL